MAPLSKEALLNEVRSILSADGGVRLALLFGSRAEDRARPDSDVDLAVDAPGVDLLALAGRLSDRLGIEVDVVSLDSASIPLLEELIAHGIVAHESERGRAPAWRSKVLAQLETDRPWFRRMRDAWLARVAREGLRGGQ